VNEYACEPVIAFYIRLSAEVDQKTNATGKLSGLKWSRLYPALTKNTYGWEIFEKSDITCVCLMIRTISKGSASTTALHRKHFFEDISQQQYVQPWTVATLIIDSCDQGLLFQNIWCIPPHFTFKNFHLPHPP
jgi:hypothetical protein